MKPCRKGETPGWLKTVWEMKPCDGCGVVAGECLCKYIEEASMSKEFCYVTNFTQGGVDCYASISIRAYFYVQQPDYCADNRDDFWGYTDIEWEVARTDIFLEETGEFLYSESCQDVERYGVTDEDIREWLLEQMEKIGGEEYDW